MTFIYLKCEFIFVRNDFDSQTEDLLSKMLELDPLKRIKAEEALRHEYFE